MVLGTVNEMCKRNNPNPRIIYQSGQLHPWEYNHRGYSVRNNGEKYGFKITDAIEKIPAEAMEMFEWWKRKSLINSKVWI
jgi:excinuclease ABC subunit A